MTARVTITSLEIAGFRGFVEAQSIGLDSKSVAVFGRNAFGKSSIVDAIDFYFSPDGAVQRLTERKGSLEASRSSLPNVRAQAAGRPSYVRLAVSGGQSSAPDTRRTSDIVLTKAAKDLLALAPVRFIIRGNELRSFVEDMTPQRRYERLAEWLGLERLVRAQEALRALRLDLGKLAKDRAKVTAIDASLKTATKNGQVTWNEKSIVAWLNATYKLNERLPASIVNLDANDPGVLALAQAATSEQKVAGIDSLASCVRDLETLSAAADTSGSIEALLSALTTAQTARDQFLKEQAAAPMSGARLVWDAALSAMRAAAMDQCPVCTTPFADSPLHSSDRVIAHLEAQLDAIKSVRAADDGRTAAAESAEKARDRTVKLLERIATAAELAGASPDVSALDILRNDISGFTAETQLSSGATLTLPVTTAHLAMKEREKRARSTLGTASFSATQELVLQLIALKAERLLLLTRIAEIAKVHVVVERIEALTNERLRDHVAKSVRLLQGRANAIYKGIQGATSEPPMLKLDLPGEDDKEQRRLRLVIDFDKNRLGVEPQHYLSDSQVHSLALALCIAAVTSVNAQFPFIVLDDVVSSYDAENRIGFIKTLASELREWQVLLLTHDDVLFDYLPDYLAQAQWKFEKIETFSKEYGPGIKSYGGLDQDIEADIAAGRSVMNLIRRAEERWLIGICEQFSLLIPMPSILHPYRIDRSAIATALARFVKDDLKQKPPIIAGAQNSFLGALNSGKPENLGSHFQALPAALPSRGDEIARWTDFKEFRALFVCPMHGCGAGRFVKRIGIPLPVCTRCGTPFGFVKVQRVDDRPAA